MHVDRFVFVITLYTQVKMKQARHVRYVLIVLFTYNLHSISYSFARTFLNHLHLAVEMFMDYVDNAQKLVACYVNFEVNLFA